MKNSHYAELERLFAELLTDPELTLSEAEKSEVDHFIYYGEYGIALETAVAIFNEENLPVSTRIHSKLRELAELMRMDALALFSRLESRNKASQQ